MLRSTFRILLLLLPPLCCSPSFAAAEGSDGQRKVTLSEVRAFLSEVPPQGRARILADRQSLSGFVASQLRDRRIAVVARDSGFADREEIRAAMEKARRDVLVSRFLESELMQMLESAPNFRELAKERYEANRRSFIRPEAVRVAHILLPVDVEDDRYSEQSQLARAEEVLSRLKGGEEFGRLAKEFSSDRGTLEKGGELPGWVERGKLVPPFERAAFGLNPGQTSGIVRTRFGFHIVKNLDHRAPTQQPFSDVEAQLIGAIRAEYQAERKAELTRRFAGTGDVIVDDALFNALMAD